MHGLKAADEKNRKGSDIALRADLVEDLRKWLDQKLSLLQEQCRDEGQSTTEALPVETSLFDVPDKLVRILDRDLKQAGIPKVDGLGRKLDVHALRHTFGTHLATGASQRTTQEAMRHSDPSLTANIYTDPKLLNVHGALDALPALDIGDEVARTPESVYYTNDQ